MILAAALRKKLHLKHWPWRLVRLADIRMAGYPFFTAVKETGITAGTVIAA
ncbi:hypothetical protein J7E23_11970 [Pseudomonas sp. ISL-88]|uniref:hypothetical protein n=1 Tax=Pseudomonas sp. ISL-88 TaxID=2819169 RepID=UPI001BE5CC38|nr:hypothetical protein [Pseudomonas sp. ISL-88]MBT2634003.1 hypothetical protein [Bacillus sp. ISL-26]MBT2713561.1 hypothetical protein [Pseudomonas sp. ISL-88]